MKIKIKNWDDQMQKSRPLSDENMSMSTLSAAFLYNASLVWHGDITGEEYVFYPYEIYERQVQARKGENWRSSILAYSGFMLPWGMTWQARGLRRGIHAKDLPGCLMRLAPKSFDDTGFDSEGLDIPQIILP